MSLQTEPRSKLAERFQRDVTQRICIRKDVDNGKHVRKSYAHHEYARLFPMLGKQELQELADDIAKNGLRNPIIIDDKDEILDGRNRLAACAIAQVEPVYERFIGTDEEKLAVVVSCNVHRRHLSTSQRASVAAKLLPIYEAQAAKRKERKPKSVPENLPEQKGDARDKAGAAMNVSGKAVDMAAKVHAKAIPEIIDAVDRGELAVSAAAIVADMPAEEQRAISKEGPKAVREAAAKARKDAVSQPERREMLDMFEDMKQIIRDAMREFPTNGRQMIWTQLIEHLNEENIELW